MTKSAVLMLSECLRVELAPRGIGLSAVPVTSEAFLLRGISRLAPGLNGPSLQ